MKIIVLATLLACAIAAPQRLVLPRLPLNQLLKGNVHAFEPKIVGGEVVTPNKYPFQVSLNFRSLGGFSHGCGGSILNENWIVCASHCVDGEVASNLLIIAGEHDLTVDSGLEQYRFVDRFVMHESYDYFTFENDVSLIHLSTPLNFSALQVGPIPLKAQGADTPAGTNTIVSGWGTTASGGDLSDQLRSVVVPIVSDNECNIAYSGDIYPSMICAGLTQGGVDSCQGDSGGPLFTDNPLELVGIVSWGYGCAVAGYPGVYTEVSYFHDWIMSHAV